MFVTDDGVTWETLGIEDADCNFYGIDSDAFDDVWVAGGGSVYQRTGSQWRRATLGDASLRDVEVTGDDVDGLAVGGGGAVFDLTGAWDRERTPTGANLTSVLPGEPSVAVGASGTVIEN